MTDDSALSNSDGDGCVKKYLLVVAGLVVIAGALAYQNQTKLLLALVKYQSANEYEVGPPRDIPWNQGPDEALTPPGERPPNIILIVADDLGYNRYLYLRRGAGRWSG